MLIIGPAKKTIAVILAILMFTAPILAYQTSTEYARGKLEGERDARGNPLWLLAGVGCGIFGAGAAYFIKPTPPSHALMGKSPDYVLGYTEGFQNKARMSNVGYACAGWAAFAAIYIAAGGLETQE